MHNAGVSYGAQGNRPKAMDLLFQANKCKVEAKHAITEKNIAAIDVSKNLFSGIANSVCFL